MSELDCQKCGACCLEQLIPIHPGDKVPLHVQDGAVVRMTNGRCAALQGRVGFDVSCSIYENRPVVCRVMKKGDWACLEVRAANYMGNGKDNGKEEASRKTSREAPRS